MSEICVVHLVWAPLGTSPLREFVASYKENRGGLAHRLVVVFNGFGDERELDAYRALLEGVAYDALVVSPPTQDIPAYFAAARKFDAEYFCFLNSYSVLLDENWLAKMHRHATCEGVGLVGASGSAESHYTSFLRAAPERPSPELNFRGHVAEAFFKVAAVFKFRAFVKKTAHDYRGRRQRSRLRAAFDPFPNYHIRSNAFMISRDVLLRLRVGAIRQKIDAEIFESGKEGMTRQIFEMNLKALVVGRDGEAYERERWRESRTFRSGGQRNLLVSDNRTRQYAETDAMTKRLLSEYAWGAQS